MLLPNQEHPPRSDYESSGYESKASYLISASNHNERHTPNHTQGIASYLISTSNHNYHLDVHSSTRLLLISFLHQTTTMRIRWWISWLLLLISFLHQTTTIVIYGITLINCFLSHFYIKPQPEMNDALRLLIASYLISTSNHNFICGECNLSELLLISFLHQTTTEDYLCRRGCDCFLSHFYIKPQLAVL